MRALAAVRLAVACWGACGGEAWAAELQAGGGAPFGSIGAALAAAAPDDVVRVAPGTYRERLVVQRPVALVAEGEAAIVGDGRADVVRIEADDVTLRGFAVSGSGSDMMASNAGIRVHGARARIEGNRLRDNLFGIYLDRSEDVVIAGNDIEGRAGLDVGLRGPGIHLYDSRRNTIRDNRVAFVRDGIYFDFSDDNLVERNDFSRLRYGIHYMFCKANSFFHNTLRDSAAGAAIMYTSGVRFSDNQILDNRDGIRAYGLLLKDCENSIAERNAIVGNVIGIFLEGAHKNVFRRNLVAQNDVAVELYASALDNAFVENDFLENRATLHTIGRAHARWGGDGGGNYFDEYAGYDLDGDGLGDVPHRLQDAFEYLAGGHPLLGLYLESAAAAALAGAERSFPVIPGGEEREVAPSMRPRSAVTVTAPPEEPRGSRLSPLGPMAVAAGALVLAWRLRR